jgi:transposase InsO family protein
VRQPKGNGCIERIFRILKGTLLWVRPFQEVEELQAVAREFLDRRNRDWLIERLDFQSKRRARKRFLALQQAA